MRNTKTDPHILDHLEWIGFVRPTGLVVSAPALVSSGAILDRRDSDGQDLLRDCIHEQTINPKTGPEPVLGDFKQFARKALGWNFSPNGYAGDESNPIPNELKVSSSEIGELAPDYAVRERTPKEGAIPWQLLVNVYDIKQDFDQPYTSGHYDLSPQSRMERLLRNTGVTAGVLYNGKTIRLISAPRGESSGWIDFHVRDMVTTAGRPICSAMRMLLKQNRLLSMPKGERLTALLENSRKYQNEVSERLAEQVLHALYELLRGFQAADDTSHGELLKSVLTDDPDTVYRALLTVLLRIVFLLYAEERDMLPGDETFIQYYSLGGLHERLREDAALHPDTMDQRFGAWAQLLVLFRMVYDGASYGDVNLPKRHGDLFDPERYPFLEGNGPLPLVPDGTIYRTLEKLLILDGERLSYRALDVEQIGSVYETMMGFLIETATGKSISIKAEKKHGAPTTIDLEALLAEPSVKREKWLQDNAGRKLSDTVKKTVKEASSLTDLHAALDKVIDKQATPDIVAKGSLILQPSEERRRSGSHYTPRSLTEPIVRTTLEPILSAMSPQTQQPTQSLGGMLIALDEHVVANSANINTLPPTPGQILDLKICDPAMGSGAFLVETCRQLADSLIESWQYHGGKPDIPPDEDDIVFARRLIAQRCLYGVDKNPMAVDLAKVSLWLVTLAKDHAFTFLDHSLRHGDSLVGLTQEQIGSVHWKPTSQGAFLSGQQREALDRASGYRRDILAARDDVSYDELRRRLDMAEEALRIARFIGDSIIAAFISGKDAKSREAKRREVGILLEQYFDKDNPQEDARKPLDTMIAELRSDPHGIPPFHWHIEFPEVFITDASGKPTRGFDAIVGNPPFAGKNTLAAGTKPAYPTWLQELHVESHGNADLVAQFFRRAYNLIRKDGAFGLIATNTIGQGDTRSTGLRWICTHGGDIYNARKRVKWPGQAAVVVSVIHVSKGKFNGVKYLNGKIVENITAFLFHRGGNNDPKILLNNANKSFQGSIVLGMGFTFDDTDKKGIASPVSEMHQIIKENPSYQEVIFPYIGGEEVNESPTHMHKRYIINMGERNENECWDKWPILMNILKNKVKPERDKQNDKGAKLKWWQYIRPRPELHQAIMNCERVISITRISTNWSLTFLDTTSVFSDSLVIFATSNYSAFSNLQCSIHEIWSRLMGSSMKDDLRYTPSDCFETFPFPFVHEWESNTSLESIGKEYYEYRATLMIRNNEGLTKTYNRFHNPEERDPEIIKLRELHAKMDRAVLDAYGWQDIPTDCEFILDYEDDEDDSNSKRKKPWRYRWPDDVRDEVLARLLELNAERAAEEERAGLTKTTKGKKSSSVKDKDSANGDDGDEIKDGLFA